MSPDPREAAHAHRAGQEITFRVVSWGGNTGAVEVAVFTLPD